MKIIDNLNEWQVRANSLQIKDKLQENALYSC